ncbi:T9SS type A sorting domain-containing protein [Psychroserpens sp. AS72]|uniref:DUF7619 domain-containing protein n=1 Tax=Psychroserpens sp. AS72 TaxID=3135775 RepID=UPI003170FC52
MNYKLSLLLFFALFASNAQILDIPDANFKNALVNTNCAVFDEFGQNVGDVDTNDDGEIQITEAEAVLKLNVANLNISSLIGINSFINLEELRCNNNQLDELDLSGLNNISILDCYNNQITALDVSNFINQSYINCNDNQISNFNAGATNSIVWLQCRNNQLSSLDMSGSIYLEVLFCSNNNLNSLFMKNGSNEASFGIFNGNAEDSLNFNNNINLEYICVDASEKSIVQSLIDNYGYDCEVNSLCDFTPGGEFYLVEGNTKFDFDTNGCDEADTIVPNFKLNIDNGVNTGATVPNETGDFSIPVQSGNYIITPDLENPDYFSVSPPNIIVDFPANQSPLLQNFCFIPNGLHNDLQIYVIPISQASPGFDSYYKIIYRNAGNVVLSGSVEFNYSFDSDYMQYVSSIPSEISNTNSILSWDYTNLIPFETREIEVNFILNTPTNPDFPLNSGDELNFDVTINPTQNDETPNNNDFGLKQIVVNSFDPNDITCLEGETIAPERVGDYVHYVIRFENLGTANATNIVVKNTIDDVKFDINTLIPIDGSHDYYTRINAQNEVEFIFENINLPFDDVTNDGYVLYKIKTLESLVLGDTFTNLAEIYFDFNAPIITNTYTTEIAEDDLSVLDFNLIETKVYPNPVNDILTIESDAAIHQATCYDINGRIIINSSFNESLTQLDMSPLKSGIYFIKLESNSQIETIKVVKK